MLRLLIIFLLLLSPLSSFCYAINEDEPINLAKAIELALYSNPQIKMKKLDIESSSNNIKIANKLQNPSIHTSQNIGPTAIGNSQEVGGDYVLEILKRNKRKTAANTNLQMVINNEKMQEQALIVEVKKAYIDLLLKKTNLKIIEEQKQLSKELYETILEESKKGIINKTEAIQAKIAYNRAIMYSNIAKSQVISSQNFFNSVLNSSEINYNTQEDVLDCNYKNLLTLDPLNNSLSFEKIKQHTLKNRFDLIAANYEVELAKNNLEIAKSQLIPDIELSGGYAYQSANYSDSGQFRNGAYAGAKIVNIPLIYQYKPEIKNAKNEIEKAKLKHQDLETDVTRNITDAYERYTIARQNLNFYNSEMLENSKELLKSSLLSLSRKETNITNFIVSKKLYLEVILGYNETLAEYYLSYAELLGQMNIQSIEDL